MNCPHRSLFSVIGSAFAYLMLLSSYLSTSFPVAADPAPETLPAPDGNTRSKTGSGWYSGTLDEALNQAGGRLVMVKLSAEWCTPCHQLQKDVFGPQGAGLSLLDQVVALSIDFDSPEGQQITQTYAVLGIPAVLFLKPDGKEKGRILGYEKPETFVKEATRILVEEWDQVAFLRDKLTGDPTNGKWMVDLAVELLGRCRAKGDVFETEAMALLKAARATDPNNEKRIAAAAVRTEGRYDVRVRKEFAKGEATLLEGLRAWPDSPDADGLRFWAATAIWRGGDPKRATDLMLEATEQTPGRAMAHMLLADFLLLMGGDAQLGEKHAKMAVALDPNNGWNHYLVAKFAFADGRVEQARAAINKAVAIEPHTAIYLRFAEQIPASDASPDSSPGH